RQRRRPRPRGVAAHAVRARHGRLGQRAALLQRGRHAGFALRLPRSGLVPAARPAPPPGLVAAVGGGIAGFAAPGWAGGARDPPCRGRARRRHGAQRRGGEAPRGGGPLQRRSASGVAGAGPQGTTERNRKTAKSTRCTAPCSTVALPLASVTTLI